MKIRELRGEIIIKWLAEDDEPLLRCISLCEKVEDYLNNEVAEVLKKRHLVALTVRFKKKNIMRGE